MKIEAGHGVVFLLRNTKGKADYASAAVWKLTDKCVSLADVKSPLRLTGVVPTWVFTFNIVAFTETPAAAGHLTARLNALDEREREARRVLAQRHRKEQEELAAAHEEMRQMLVEEYQLSEKEDDR